MKPLPIVLPQTIPINHLLKAEEWLKPRVSNDLFVHSQNVAEKARELGAMFELPEPYIQRLGLSGFFHDCAKEMVNDEMLEFASEHNIQISQIDRMLPNELHPKVGATLVRLEFGVQDKNVLGGIEYHSYGKPHMSELQKIIVIADDSAEGRPKEAIDAISEALDGKLKNLDRAVKVALSLKLAELGSKKKKNPERQRPLHPDFIRSWQFYNGII